MRNFKIKDLMVSVLPNEYTGYSERHLKAGMGQVEAGCMAVSKCSATKPDCMAVSKCSATKPDCMAVSKCSATKPTKNHEDSSAYAVELWNLKQEIAGMQAK